MQASATRRKDQFAGCEICGRSEWREVYAGPVRDGAFGRVRESAAVAQCGGCGVQRLAEAFCIPDAYYESGEYRQLLQQSLETGKALREQDAMQFFTSQALREYSLRGKVVADVGCGIGSFLDLARGRAARTIGIEPCVPYRESLRARGYEVYGSAPEAAAALGGAAELAVSIQVIEHVADPVGFLRQIAGLMAPDGLLVLSTPNRDDVLMKILPEAFPAFFYRTVHRWYFDAASLAVCAERAGFEVVETRFVHRYGLSNALRWLRDRAPSGWQRLPGIDEAADRTWQAYLEGSGQSDCLYMALRLRSAVGKRAPAGSGRSDT
jgi:SAM-dependent methyltransferase